MEILASRHDFKGRSFYFASRNYFSITVPLFPTSSRLIPHLSRRFPFEYLAPSHEGQYDKEQVLAAATVIQAVANAGLNPFFVPGTDKGVGFHDSKAKPEAVDPAQAAKLNEVITGFRKDANELVKVATIGDKEATRTQFGNLTRHCKSCHDDFRAQ